MFYFVGVKGVKSRYFKINPNINFNPNPNFSPLNRGVGGGFSWRGLSHLALTTLTPLTSNFNFKEVEQLAKLKSYYYIKFSLHQQS